MAIELKYAWPIVLFVCASMIEIYCIDGPQTSTTPWPELGSRRRQQQTTPWPKRDFVSQPSVWNEPSSNIPSAPQQPISTKATTPNPNIKLSYAGAINPANNKNMPSAQSPTRDYVNPNIQLSYANSMIGQNNNKLHTTSPPKNIATPTLQTTSISTNNKATALPSRDYVNPNAPISYSNAVIKPNNNLPAGVSIKPEASTTPASRVSGINNIKNDDNNNGNQGAASDPKDRENENNELREFSENLIRRDSNNAFKHVKVNYQGMTRSSSLKDEAPQPLLTIDEAAYKIPSIEKLVLLHNNYILESDKNEVYTAAERVEENNFLDTILSTPVMQQTRTFLISKGKLSKDPKDFKDILRTVWFNMYSRGGGRIGSSGFEHIFLGEIKNGGISGLHNWLYFNEEEKKNTANYLGYLKKLEFEKGAILKFHFNFQNIDKPVGSMFIGTSPEFELALYSTCFLVRPDDVCPLRLGGKNFVIRTYTYRYRGKTLIGSAFPEI